MTSNDLEILPLFWIFHDQWAWRTWHYTSWGGWCVSETFPHRGHVHFYMSGHKRGSQQAYKGSQVYIFSLRNKWSSGSGDVNQSDNIRVIGTPKWYLYVKEYWRRVYIQPWDAPENVNLSSHIGKTGIKYDASPYHLILGPHRETKDNFFYWTNMSRTLPIEYFRDDKKYIRDHYLRTQQGNGTYHTWNVNPAQFDASAGSMLIPAAYWAGTDGSGHDGPASDNPARRYAYPDSQYIYPTIEYQEVLQSNWQRMDGYETRDLDENTFGDGFEITVPIPYRNNDGEIQSPFSQDNVVYPFGTYMHGFLDRFPGQIPRYPSDDESGMPSEFNIPNELKGQPIQFSVPSHMSGNLDGIWVEQCLGGMVLAKALVTIEDNFGSRSEVWVTDSQFMVKTPFAGTDQNIPAND
jgi:hypothetical protein